MTGCYIVTGASKGIGLETVRFLLNKFSASGVVAVSRSQPQALSDLVKQHQGRLSLLQADVGNDGDNANAVDTAIKSYGRLDGMVLNAGLIEPFSKLGQVPSIEAIQELFNVNTISLFSIIRHATKHLRESKGRVVMVSSGAAGKAYASWGPYCASKAAMNSINACLAAEEPDISTIALRPGVVSTDMQALIRSEGKTNMPEGMYKRFVELHEQGKLERPEVPAHVMASYVVKGQKELSGEFIDYTDERLKDHRLE